MLNCNGFFLQKGKFEISKFHEATFVWIVTGNIQKQLSLVEKEWKLQEE